MWLDLKFINMLGGTLQLLTRKGAGIWNYRCPLCGDSQKSKTKARGFLIQDGLKIYSMCHNCGESSSFDRFLKKVNPGLHQQYVFEKFAGNNEVEDFQPLEPFKDFKLKAVFKLPRISLLDNDHEAVKFIKNRNIPKKYHSKLYYASDFNEFARTFFSDKFQNTQIDKRIIIPLIDQHDRLLGFQGRSLDPNTSLRYVTALFNSADPKIFGLNTVNFNFTNYAFEGPFDSMFVDNSIAVLGGRIEKLLCQYKLPIDRTVICYDNEPRNKNVVSMIRKAIKSNFQVLIYPSNIHQKDINDLFTFKLNSGMDATDAKKEILQMIKTNTYKGMEAELILNSWKRCA